MTADLRKPVGSRITELKVRCDHCKVPTFSDLDDDFKYRVAMSNYLANGGDGNKILEENILLRMSGKTLFQGYQGYQGYL